MIFFMAMPFLTGLINIVVPQQIGARDVAFPFLNSVSLWLTAAGAGAGHGVAGDRRVLDRRLDRLSAVLRASQYSPGVGVDYWIWAFLIAASARR